MIDLSVLNSEQRKAVETSDGPLLLLAGAGSGKTRVITYRIAHLIEDKNVSPESILALTFTKKAANEMKERIFALAGEHLSGGHLYVGTFHGFGAYTLRRYGDKIGLDSNFSIYDGDDQLGLVKAIMKEQDVDDIVKPQAVLQEISNAKLKEIREEEYFRNSFGDYFNEVVSRVYRQYQKRLKSLNAVDFNDLLSLVLQLINQNTDVIENLQNRYKYLLVDEYQDTNIQQYKIVATIAKANRNICVVGDEDQSIYSWRGASIENINLFRRDFPEHRTIKLEQNYRSTPIILEAANSVIAKNPNRIKKNLWTNIKEQFPIVVAKLEDPLGEAMFVLRMLENYKDNLDDVAVLYRVNSLSRSFEEVFVKYGVPYQLVGGVGFYQRMEVKDLLAYLKFINNPKDEVSLLRIINIPARGLGPKAISDMRQIATQLSLTLSDFVWHSSIVFADEAFAQSIISFSFVEKIKEIAGKTLEKHGKLFEALGKAIIDTHDENKPISQILRTLIEDIDYKIWITRMSGTKEEQDSRESNISELINVIAQKKYKGRDGLQLFLEDVSLTESVKDSIQSERETKIKGKVNLMTIHAAKGLEFNTVFLVGLEAGIFPHSRSVDDPVQLQEERRLFYVAITRARRYLYLTHALSRQFGSYSANTTPSPYLEEIPKHLVTVV